LKTLILQNSWRMLSIFSLPILCLAFTFSQPIQSKEIEDISKSVIIDNMRVNYIDVGEGPTLILIHGLGADLSKWEKNILHLSLTYRVIALDLPGFGKSDRVNHEYRGTFFINVIRELMDYLGVSKATLIGNSMGGWLSLLFAETYPQQTEKLILVAPAFVKGLPPGVTAENIALRAKPQKKDEMSTYLQRVFCKPPTSRNDILNKVSSKNLCFVFKPTMTVSKIFHKSFANKV